MPLLPPVSASMNFEPVASADGINENPMRPLTPDIPLSETMKAGWQRDNPVYNTMKWLDRQTNYGEPDFDFIGSMYQNHLQGTDLETYADSFTGVRNQKEFDALAAQIREEQRATSILAASSPGAALLASSIAGLASPTTLFPVFTVAKTAHVGMTALKSALAVGSSNVAAMAIDEAILHGTQATRTHAETGMALGGSFLLGTLLGGATGGLSSVKFKKLSEALENLQVSANIDKDYARQAYELKMGQEAQSAGAAAIERPAAELKGALGLEKTVSKTGPYGRTMNAPEPSVREAELMNVEAPGSVTRNREGYSTSPIGGSIETRTKTQGVAPLGRTLQELGRIYLDYRFGDPNTKLPGLKNLVNPDKTKLSHREFHEEVGKAAARMDEHANPFVAKAAKVYREKLIEPLAANAVRERLLNPELVRKGRPAKAATVADQAKKLEEWAGPKATPAQRKPVDDLLTQMEEFSGVNFDKAVRDYIVDRLANNPENMDRLRRAFYGNEDVPFALRDVRGQHISRVLDDLEDGYPYVQQRSVVERVEAIAKDVRLSLPEAVRDIPINVMVGVQPKAGDMVEISFRGIDGGFRTVDMTRAEFGQARAFSIDGGVFLTRTDLIGDVSQMVGGEIRHELVHALFSTERITALLGRSLFDHAESLNVLDMPLREYLQKVGDDAWEQASVEPVRDVYAKQYSKMSDAAQAEAMAQEAIAHMVELRHHGALTDEQLAPILDDLDNLFGKPAPVGEAQKRIVGEWIADLGYAVKAESDGSIKFALRGSDVDVGRSMRADLDRLGYFSGALEAAKRLRQNKGTPEQMLAMLQKEGAKKAEIEATGLDKFILGRETDAGAAGGGRPSATGAASAEGRTAGQRAQTVKQQGQPLFAMRGLDMSPEARKARAEEQKWTENGVWYHASPTKEFEAFRKDLIGNHTDGGHLGRGFYFADNKGEARYYADHVNSYYVRGRLLDLGGGGTWPEMFKQWAPHIEKLGLLGDRTETLSSIKKIDDLVDRTATVTKWDNDGVEGYYASMPDPTDPSFDIGIHARKYDTPKTKEEALDKLKHTAYYKLEKSEDFPGLDLIDTYTDFVRTGGLQDAITEAAERAGYSGIKYGSEIVVFDPTNIRSVNAAFDPSKADSPNLMYALRDLSRRLDAPLVDDLAKTDKHPGRVMAVHGTKAQPFDQFDPAKSSDFGVHFGTRDQADIPAGFTTTRENARMIPVVLDLKTVVDVPDMMTWPPVEVAHAVEKAYPLARGLTERVRAVIAQGPTETGPTGSSRPSREALAAGKAELRRLMTEAKIDGLRYWNDSEGEGWSYIVWDQGKVTSATSGQPMMGVAPDRQPTFASRGEGQMSPEDAMRQNARDIVRAAQAMSPAAERVGGADLARGDDGSVSSVMMGGKKYDVVRDADGNIASVNVGDAPAKPQTDPVRDLAMLFASRGDDILKTIRDLGGIKDETGDLANMGAGERKGIINNETGLSPDAMRAHLVEKGYLDDVQYEDVTQSSVNDLYDLVDEALRDPSNRGRAYREEMAHQALRSIQDAMDEQGIKIKLTPEQEDTLVRMVLDQRMSPEGAVEQLQQKNMGEPPVKDGFVRMYHGGAKSYKKDRGELDFTTDKATAQGLADQANGQVWYVDIPQAHPAVKEGGARLNAEISARAKKLKAVPVDDVTAGPLSRPSNVDPERYTQTRREMEALKEAAEAQYKMGHDPLEGQYFNDEIGDEVWGGTPGQSYIMRLYNHEKIIRRRTQFRAILADYFQQSQQRATSALRRMERDIADAEAKALQSGREYKMSQNAEKDLADLRAFVDMDRAELEKHADGVIDNILGRPDLLTFDLPASLRGALKSRTLRIPDAFESASGKFEDFLDRDVRAIGRAYVHSVVVDTEIMRMHGSLNMEEWPIYAKMKDEYHALVNNPELDKLPPAKAEKIKAGLERDWRRATRDLQAQIDRMRGIYKLPDDPTSWGPRTLRVIKEYNLIRMLGSMTVSAITDIPRVVMVHGFMDTMRYGVRPLFGHLRALRLAGDEVQMSGTALDMVLGSRIQAIADVLDNYGRYSKGERGLGWLAEKFGYWTLMNQWNSAMKQWVGAVTMTKIIKACKRVADGTATKADIDKLASSNIIDKATIDTFAARKIAEQFDKHGMVEGGLHIPNSEAWDVADPNVRLALDALRGAIVRDVDRIIVTPGQEKPLWFSTQMGSVILQFKSFAASSMEKTLIAGLQQRDAGVFMGASLMVALGAVVEWAKSFLNDKPLPATNAQWVAAAIDRSGLLGWFSDVNNVTEKMTRGTVGVSALTGKELSRFASRNVIDALAGPTFGTIGDMTVASGGLFSSLLGGQQVRQSDLAAVRRLIPLQNLFYLSNIFQQLEKSAGQSLGAKRTKSRSPLMDRLSLNEPGWLDEFVRAA